MKLVVLAAVAKATMLATTASGDAGANANKPEKGLRATMPSAMVGHTQYPYATLEQAETGRRIGQVRVTSERVSLTQPLVANEGRTRLDLSLTYQRIHFDYRDLTHPLDSVHALGATAFLRQSLTNPWGLIAVVAPGYADDFKGPATTRALTLTLVGAASYRFSARFEVGLGVALQNRFGSPLVIPVAAVDWTLTDRLWLRSLLPISVELTWLPVDPIGLRAEVRTTGGNFHGAERIYAVENPQLNYSAVAAEAGARWFFLGPMHFTVHGGYTLYRRFEFSADGSAVPGGTYHLANGPVFGVDLGVGR